MKIIKCLLGYYEANEVDKISSKVDGLKLCVSDILKDEGSWQIIKACLLKEIEEL